MTVTTAAAVGCKTNKPIYTVFVQATGTNRTLTAQISSSNGGKKASWAINWESFQ